MSRTRPTSMKVRQWLHKRLCTECTHRARLRRIRDVEAALITRLDYVDLQIRRLAREDKRWQRRVTVAEVDFMAHNAPPPWFAELARQRAPVRVLLFAAAATLVLVVPLVFIAWR